MTAGERVRCTPLQPRCWQSSPADRSGNHHTTITLSVWQVDGAAMVDKYQIRQGADGLWEIVETATGELVHLGGLLLAGLDRETAMGALDVLHNAIVEPNGSKPSGTNGESV